MKSPAADLITAEIARLLLSYNPENGSFTWNVRGEQEISDPASRKAWNAKHAGKSAGGVSPSGYVLIGIRGQRFYAHRLAWLISYGSWPEKFIDHINHDKADNRISNIRQATELESVLNRRKTSNNRSGVKGVSWFARDGLWRARIDRKGKSVYIKYFKSLQESKEAISAKRREIDGDFTCNE